MGSIQKARKPSADWRDTSLTLVAQRVMIAFFKRNGPKKIEAKFSSVLPASADRMGHILS